MDLRAYYKGMKEIESTISAPFVVVISLNTADGGKADRATEVSRAIAARLIADGRARLARSEEEHAFYENQADARREAETVAAAQRMQVMLVPSVDAKPFKNKTQKD